MKKILGKPSGITLRNHTQHVVDQVQMILPKGNFLEEKYLQMVQLNLKELVLQAAEFHDFGKKHQRWQKACQLDFQAYNRWRIQKELPIDKPNATHYRAYVEDTLKQKNRPGVHLMKAKLRHEFASLLGIENRGVEVNEVVKVAIAAHHGKLNHRFGDTRWREDGKIDELKLEGPFYKYWKSFNRLSHAESSTGELDHILLNRYKFAAVRALLQLADTRASRLEGEGPEAVYAFQPFMLQEKDWVLRPVQQAAIELADQPISILRAPTGSGKTYASLLWANEQIKNRKADRLVIAMPTRFTSNALAINVAEEIDKTGLYHSSAWYNRYGDLKDRSDKKDALEAHRMAKFLATPVCVCTIDHLLIALTGTKEQHHSTFFFLANSAVVFDEADFYDPFVQANLVVLLRSLRTLKVPVLIMSATIPDSARIFYNVSNPITSPPFKTAKNKKYLKWVEHEEDGLNVLKQMIRLRQGIIYANTIKAALNYYFVLHKLIKNPVENQQLPILLYHSRFTESDKKDIEQQLIQHLGKKAWEGNAKSPVEGIAIMTQIGEMSVNISSSIMLSEHCPWDRLAQRVGRLVRFDLEDAQEGTCYIIQPQKEGTIYPAPYGTFNRSKMKWEELEVTKLTREQLKKQFFHQTSISEKDFEVYVNQLYDTVLEVKGKDAVNQKKYYDLIRNNWLIVPDISQDEDEGIAGHWSSRHMPPQVLVLTKYKSHFATFNSYQEHILNYGVNCPKYLIDKELRRLQETRKIGIGEIKILKGEHIINCYYTRDYHPKFGLSFLYVDNLERTTGNQIL